MRSRRCLALALSTLFVVTLLAADDWPHWRGPDRTGSAQTNSVPSTWSKSENIVWKLPLPGMGGATPIIWQDRVFLNIADGRSLQLWCVDRTDGKVLWQRDLDDRNEKKRKGNMSSPSPVTDGKSVWVMTGTGILTAFDFAGEQLWKRDLQNEFGKFGILHGYSSSPLLHAGILFVQVLHGFHTDDPSYVMAIAGDSGETIWRVERPTDAPKESPDAYTTPALLHRDGKSVIVVSGADYVTGHDPADGREVWRVSGLNPSRNPMQRIVASPVVSEEMIIVPSRVNPLLALSTAKGIDQEPSVAWSMDRGPDVPTPVVDNGLVYLLNDQGIVWCLDARDGRVVWGPERIPSASYSASPLIADGKLFATNEQGLTTVMRSGRDFEIIGENSIDEYTLSSLAIVDGQIFLRTADHLYCIGNSG